MRCSPMLVLLLFALSPSLPLQAQEDETDKTVYGKRASEWMKVLRESNEVLMRRRALLAIESAGPLTRKVFEEIGSVLRLDKEEIVRQQAAGVLGRLGAKALEVERVDKIPVKPAIDALSSSMSRERSPAVRVAVATALGRIGREAKAGVPMLGDALKDDNVDVRAASAEALAKIGPPSTDVLKQIIDALRDGKNKDGLRVRAGLIAAVQRIGRPEGLPAVPVLIEVLGEPEPSGLSQDERRKLAEVRRQTVEALGVLGDLAALGTLNGLLKQALEAKDTDMARVAITALTQLSGDKKPLVPVLIGAVAPQANQLQDRFVRCQAIHALGQLGKELGQLAKEQDETRKLAVGSLRGCLSDKLSEVKLAAALALGELGPEIVGEDAGLVVDALKVLKKSTEKSIVEAADAAIRRLEKKP